ncbi:DUF4105 domain-containing protein [Maribacter luteus]|uniref:DUF4105 domain-containing protein n=1 Tax=Maribacter luteus TaxID=2594478 RepID=A0A6I2MSZ9_9FLAO|nr:DUF4105 domain-containing protein [Maribacter luteus]MRX64436.1 DUF4105 domain-containing protein [Maribacter luteus]
MPFKRFVTFLLLLTSLVAHSQTPELTPLSKISVLTCGPGDQLYSTFGHSAFRVKDPAIGIDVVYNYGVFDFYSDNFYVKFAQGKLDYMLARQQFSNFIREYKHDKRWVNEQVLQLSQSERNELFQFLENNYLPENRAYPYDFFYNNCATKIWDVLDSVYHEKLVFNEGFLDKQYTHRELIRLNMPLNSWSSFGIDLALGAVIDDVATPKEHMFLPQYIMQQLNSAQLDNKPIAPKETSIYKPGSHEHKSSFISTPLFWTLALLIIVVTLTVLDFKKNRRTKSIDFVLFLLTGIAGIVIFFLWFLTDHSATANNLNILWAFPLNLIFAFMVCRKKPLPLWASKYFLFLIILILAVIILWLLNVQIFSPVLIPILLALGTRYSFLYRYKNQQNPISKI